MKIANFVSRWCVKGFVEIFYVETLGIRSDADEQRIFNPICLVTHRLHVDIRGISKVREHVVKLVPDCFRINCAKPYPTIAENGSYNTHTESGLVLLAWHIRPDVTISRGICHNTRLHCTLI